MGKNKYAFISLILDQKTWICILVKCSTRKIGLWRKYLFKRGCMTRAGGENIMNISHQYFH